MVGIKNNGKEAIKARYDGRDYTFRPGVSEVVSPDAARHIFGLGLEDKSRALQRLGWLRESGQLDAALARLGEIQFLAVEQRVDEPEAKIPEKATNTLHLPAKAESKIDISKGA